jgi:phosphotriesterase-related protein
MNSTSRILKAFIPLIVLGCAKTEYRSVIHSVNGAETPVDDAIWLTHEHLLVDFIGADSINPERWNQDSVIKTVIPFLEEVKAHEVTYFVDATPAYLGRDVVLLQKIARRTGLTIITNTGFYGAVKNKYLPAFAFSMSPEELAEVWIHEYEHGIDGTEIKPGFIKISVDATETLDAMHERLVRGAAIAHLSTGLTIASHTGEAIGLWPQLKILDESGVSAEAFVWVHAQNEKDNSAYLRAANEGCWISLDGLGWELDNHVEKLVFARDSKILDRILISHDAGWYTPQNDQQSIKPYTAIFTKLYPALKARGFSDEEFSRLLSENPKKAFSLKIRKRDSRKG